VNADPTEERGSYVELLRVHPELVDVVAQLLWVAAQSATLGRAPPDDSGLVPLVLARPLDPSAAAAFEAGLDALLAEASFRDRGVYLRELRDRRGARRELSLPTAPEGWGGAVTMVGPFQDEGAATQWRAGLAPPLVGDVVEHVGRWYVDVFVGEADPSD
jgi:hypothetical protein